MKLPQVIINRSAALDLVSGEMTIFETPLTGEQVREKAVELGRQGRDAVASDFQFSKGFTAELAAIATDLPHLIAQFRARQEPVYDFDRDEIEHRPDKLCNEAADAIEALMKKLSDTARKSDD